MENDLNEANLEKAMARFFPTEGPDGNGHLTATLMSHQLAEAQNEASAKYDLAAKENNYWVDSSGPIHYLSGARGAGGGPLVPFRELQEKAKLQRAREQSLALADKIYCQCTEIEALKKENARLIISMHELRDEYTADRERLLDQLFGRKAEPAKASQDLSRAISNTNFGASNTGLPLHDRY